MANYSNVDIKKYGDLQQQNSAGHNLRQIPSRNVNTKKSHLNRFLVGSADMHFPTALADKLKRFKKIRKNAVRSVNLVFSASPDFFKDKSKAAQWEKATFDFIVKEFGEKNIVYAVAHLDEKTTHIHASIVPVDPAGKLNASHFFDGRKKCDDFATRYNQAVKHLGLKRDKGIKKAEPQETAEFYEKVQESKRFDEQVDRHLQEAEKELSSPWPLLKVSTAKAIFKPIHDIVKRYKAKALADREKIRQAEKVIQENDDLKLKFDNMGLSPAMSFIKCKEIGKIIEDGLIAKNQAPEVSAKGRDLAPHAVPKFSPYEIPKKPKQR